MSKEKNNRGGRAQSQRVGRQMSKADKTINNAKADDHMGKLEQLRKDVPDNQRHIDQVREKKGLEKLEGYDAGLEQSDSTELEDVLVDEEVDRELADSDLIVCVRVFDFADDGCLVGRKVSGDEFCARHRQVRRTRNSYREIGGALVEVGKEYTTRKEKSRKRKELKRKATGVLRSIMVRLMPHEAEMAGVLKESQIACAVDRVARAYQKSTGCEIISAAVHRMHDEDLHIHLQYSMIIAREEKDGELARRVSQWKRELTALARAKLKEEGNAAPGPVTVGKRKKQLVAEGAIDPKPEREMVWQKVKGLRSMRDDSILGYSFRQKLNLVRAAEAFDEYEIAKKVAAKNDSRRLFRPIANRSDEELDKRYRDLWLERLWRESITEMLPASEKSKLKKLGLQAARNYETYGTSQVEKTHIDRRVKELAEQQAHIQKREEQVATGEAALKVKDEQNKGYEKDLKDGFQKLEVEKTKLKRQELALKNEAENLEKLKKEADAYRVLKTQVVSFINFIMTLSIIQKQMSKKTRLGKAIGKLAKMVGVRIKEGPEMGS